MFKIFCFALATVLAIMFWVCLVVGSFVVGALITGKAILAVCLILAFWWGVIWLLEEWKRKDRERVLGR